MIKAKFIFASSCGAPQSLSPYSASKLAGEALCKAYRHSYDMDIVILRLANIYGPHSLHKESVVAKFIKAKLNNESVTIYGNGEQTRDFVHVLDVCKAIYEAKEDKQISSSELHSINYIADWLELEKKYTDPIPGEISQVDPLIGVSAYPFNLGLKDTYDWFKENYVNK